MDTMTKLKVIQLIGLLSAVVGLIVMLAWVFNIPLLRSFVVDVTTMKFSTALCFLFSGIILHTMATPMRMKWNVKKYTLLLFSILMLVVMVPVFLTVTINATFDFTPYLFFDKVSPGVDVYKSLPSIGTSIGFIFIGLSSLLAYTFSRHVRFVLLYAGSIVSFLGKISLIGLVLNVPTLYFEIENVSAGISLHGSILFVLLGLGFFLVGTMGLGNCPYYKGMKDAELVMCGYDWIKHRK